MSPRRCLLLGACLLALALPARADMDAALDACDAGDAALASGDAAAALKHYASALEAEAGCLPARFGLGEAALASGDMKTAILAWRRVVRDIRATASLPVAWKALAPRARARLTEHDGHGAELEAKVDEHVKKLVRLAARYRKRDPDLADRTLEAVLALRPEHERARELLRKLASQGARKEEVFDGKQIQDWDGGRGQWWSVQDGVIVSETAGVATFIRNQKPIEGNFDVLMEARIAKAHDKAPFLALMASWKAEYDHTRFGTLSGALTWYEYTGEDERERVFREEAARLRPPFDPSAWTTYELRYREDWIHAVINGREVHKIRRPSNRPGGYVGILSQGCRGEVRRLDVLHR